MPLAAPNYFHFYLSYLNIQLQGFREKEAESVVQASELSTIG